MANFKDKRQNQENNDGIESVVVEIRRVTKATKGGRSMKFSALVVCGDKNGKVGIGIGKAKEIPVAQKKAVAAAKKAMVEVPMVGTTIPHRIIGDFGSGKVLLLPAEEGTGVIAGGAVRVVLELAGVKDIRTKSLGTNNKINVARATIKAIESLMTVETVAKLRGKTAQEILG